jgi:AAA15 family ATPase/GTPase
MLIDFSVANHLSFFEKGTLSLLASSSIKEPDKDNHVFTDTSGKYTLLKSVVIYGANGSGKSNLLKSIRFMKAFLLDSYKNALGEGMNIPVQRFALNSAADEEPAFFEINFILDEKRYRYGFELDNEKVISEWLFYVNTIREIELFTRDEKGISVKTPFKEGKGLENKTKQNVLFLTRAAHDNGKIASKVIDWFKNIRFVSGLQDVAYRQYTIDKIKNNPVFKKQLLDWIPFLDIENITSETHAPMDLPKSIQDAALKSVLQRFGQQQDKLLTWHKKFDANGVEIDRITFDFESQESEGTQKIISLLGPWLDALENGRILIVDEMDARLHSLLTKQLIDWFHTANPNHAQLIFVAHDTHLLTKDVFRRDQIWFTEKTRFGATELYSLLEYKEAAVRSETAFDKNYLKGKYGAIPQLDGIQKNLFC